MKKKMLLIIAIVACSCESDQARKQREVEENIYSTLTTQAKCILTNPSTYEFESMSDYRVNDTIRVYAQKFSGANDFGVRESKYALGYFNINTGYEIDGALLEMQASPAELKAVKQVVGAR